MLRELTVIRRFVIMRWLRHLVVISGVLFITQLTPASKVYAVSDYDNVITNATQLKLSYPGYADMDITTDYMGYIMGTITDGVAQNNCDSTCRNVVSDSLDHGDYAISQAYSNHPGDNYSFQAYFCDQKITSTFFYSDFSGQQKILYGSTSTPSNCVDVQIAFQSVTSGGHIFVGGNVYSNATTSAALIADNWVYWSGIVPAYHRPFVYTGAFTPPEGYEGEAPQSEYTPPTPTKTLYTGTIDCGGEMPIAMSMYQPGNIGAADLTQISLGRAQWSYSLTSDPYSFTVDCGDGKLATPYGAVDPASSSNDWMCDIHSTEPYHCVLS
jgi:hypothetical protein